MTKEQITGAMSLGNVLTALGIIIALGGSLVLSQQRVATADERIDTLEERQADDRALIRDNTNAIRGLEMNSATVKQKLENIESTLQRNERMLEQLIRAQE